MMILEGLQLVFSPMGIVWLIVGLLLGFVVGVLPGLSTSNTAALLLPFSVTLPTNEALILIMSIYAGAAFAGSVPAILVNVPGEAGSAVTALDGHQMAKQGRAGVAIGIARTASTVGGVVSGIIVLLVIGPLGALALRFGAREMFIVVLIGVVVVSTLMGKSLMKGLLSGVLGLVLSTVGGSPLSAEQRFTFGILELFNGIEFVPALIGVFAISEMLLLAASRVKPPPAQGLEGGLRRDLRDAVTGMKETFRHSGALFGTTGIGIILGVIPGIGTGVSNFISYSIVKRMSKYGDQFGKGAPQGVIASEATDNAVTAATLVPTLALGIPGSGTMAVVLAQFYIQGIQPGPNVLTRNGPEAMAAIIAIIVASLLILPIGVLMTAPLVQITKVPVKYLVPVVIVLALTASVAYRGQLFDMFVCIAFGFLGFLMRLHGFPVIPLILGLILGPMLEEHLTRALALGRSQLGYFFDSPTAIVLWCILAAVIAYLAISAGRNRAKAKRLAGLTMR